MTIKELIDELSLEEPNRLVVMARDAEGNGHSPLRMFWTGAYRADSTYSGEVGFEKLTADDKKRGYTQEDVVTDGIPAIILCPIS